MNNAADPISRGLSIRKPFGSEVGDSRTSSPKEPRDELARRCYQVIQDSRDGVWRNVYAKSTIEMVTVAGVRKSTLPATSLADDDDHDFCDFLADELDRLMMAYD